MGEGKPLTPAAAVSKLSELEIDVAKDWNTKRIANLGAPTINNDALRKGTRLTAAEMLDAASGKVLTGQGAGVDPAYETPTATIRIPIDLRNPRVSSLAGNSFFTVTGLTAWDAGHWEFVKDVDGKIYGVVSIPNNLNATPNAKIILTIAANATSGVTRLSVATNPPADGESLDPASLTGETAQDITVPATARLRKDVTFTLTNAPAPNDLLIVEIYHEGAHVNDTLAVNTELYNTVLECVVDT